VIVSKNKENPTDLLTFFVLAAVSRLTPPGSDMRDPDVHESGAEAIWRRAVSSCLDPRHWASSRLPGPGDPSLRHRSGRVASAKQTSRLRRQDLAPDASRAPGGSEALPAYGVRIEVGWNDRRTTLIHHYGHGRSGVTLSWGTARQADGFGPRSGQAGGLAVLGGGR